MASSAADDGAPQEQRRESWRIPLACLVGGLALVYLPLWLGQVLFYRDVGRWLYPARAFLHRSVGAGQSLVYNPYEGLGLPLAASPLYGLFYPGSWLPAWGSEARALSISLFLHLVWGAIGMLLLARRFELGRPAAVVVAFGWALAGPVTGAVSAGQLLAAASWFPWCGLGAIALARRLGGARSDLLVGIALAALPPAAGLLLGEVFQAALGVGFGAVVGLGWAWPRLERRAWRRAAVVVPAALLLAGLLAAPVLAPLSAALGETERSAGLTRQIAEQWSLHPLRLTELVAPQAMGDPYGSYPGGPWAGDGASDDRPLIYSVYLGAGLLLLAVIGLNAGQRAACWGLGLLAAVALLLALGRHTPVHAVFRTVVPLFAFQRAPEKYVLLLVPAVALLAGFGVRRFLSEPGKLIGAGLGGALVLALLAALPLVWPAPVALTISRGTRHALVAVAALVGLALVLRRQQQQQQQQQQRWVLLLSGVCTLDVALTALPLLIFAPADILDARPALAQLVLQHHGARPGPPRVVRDPTVEQAIARLVRQGDIVRHEALRYATLRPSLLTAHGLAHVPGYDAGLPPALEQLWLAGQQRGLALLRSLSVDYVLLGFAGDRPPQIPGLLLLGAPGPPGVAAYQVTATRPRVGVAEATDVIEGAAPVDPLPPSEAASTCRLVSHDHARIEARCSLSRPSQVVFVEQHGAGWRATVDGAPAPIRRANQVMRAVPLPAGDHAVVLEYTTPRLRAGLIAAAAGLTFVLAALLLARARRYFTAKQ